jgi:hypothetical protein
VAVNRANADDIRIATAGDGVRSSPDRGVTRFPMSDDKPSLAVDSIAVAGCTSLDGCSSIYAGMGANAIRRDTYDDAGLLVRAVDTGGFRRTLRDGKPTHDFTQSSILNGVFDRTTPGPTQVFCVTLSSERGRAPPLRVSDRPSVRSHDSTLTVIRPFTFHVGEEKHVAGL